MWIMTAGTSGAHLMIPGCQGASEYLTESRRAAAVHVKTRLVGHA